MQHIERQVFIGGCGRSGTTLLGSMLGAHMDCICPPESHFKVSALRNCRRADGTVDLPEAWRFIRMHWRFKLWHLEVNPQRVPWSSYAELLMWLVEAYAQDRGTEGRVWIDHTPENISYAPLLLKLFPQARIVHIVRDGRAVANSILPLDWGPNTMIRAAGWWQAIVETGLALEGRLPASQIVRVSYEELVDDPERALRSLCRQLDLPYQASMLQADGFLPPDYTLSQHQLVGRRPNPGRATRWKQTLTGRQVEIFESLAGPLLVRLGYTLVHGVDARPPVLSERVSALVTEWVRGNILNGVRWLRRSYPLWLSWDFLRLLPDAWASYRRAGVKDGSWLADAFPEDG